MLLAAGPTRRSTSATASTSLGQFLSSDGRPSVWDARVEPGNQAINLLYELGSPGSDELVSSAPESESVVLDRFVGSEDFPFGVDNNGDFAEIVRVHPGLRDLIEFEWKRLDPPPVYRGQPRQDVPVCAPERAVLCGGGTAAQEHDAFRDQLPHLLPDALESAEVRLDDVELPERLIKIHRA